MNITVRVVQLCILMFNWMLSGIYFFLKFFPAKKKILFCSRQSNHEPLDFRLLRETIKKVEPEIEFVTICSHIEHSIKGYMSFFICLIRSMYHLATSKVCVLDSYWPAACMLKHKETLQVVQIWHSLGKTKKSGYQTLGRKSGRKQEFADFLKMHKQYDWLIGGSPIWNPYYCEAFHLPEERILNWGLPRIDYLLDTEAANRARFFREYPQLSEKKIVLYVPTFRKHMKSHEKEILQVARDEQIVLIIKNHPGQAIKKRVENEGVYYLDDWETMDLLAVCDYVITDYSSISLEAAVLRKKTFYWTYDYDEYMENSGINLNLKDELSENVFEDIMELMACIKEDRYNAEQQSRYIEKYLPKELGGSTKKIADWLIGMVNR